MPTFNNREFLDWIDDFLVDTTNEEPELVANGDFATDTVWTKGTGWSIATGVASSDGSQAGDSDLSQTPVIALINTEFYDVTFTVSNYVAGNVTPVIGGTEGTDRTANGTFTETIIAGAGTDIDIRADLDFVGDIDNVSVKLARRVTAPNKMHIRDMAILISGPLDLASVIVEYSPDDMETNVKDIIPATMDWYQRADGTFTGVDPIKFWENFDAPEGWVRILVKNYTTTTDPEVKTRPRVEKRI